MLKDSSKPANRWKEEDKKTRMIGTFWSISTNIFWSITWPWRRLFWLSLYLSISGCSLALTWPYKFLRTSFRLMTAFRRERELEVRLHVLRVHHEEVILRNTELKTNLDAFVREHLRIVDTVDVVAVDRKKVLGNVRALRNRVNELEIENEQLLLCEEELQRGVAAAVAAKVALQKQLEPKEKETCVDLMQAREMAFKNLHDVRIEERKHRSRHGLQSPQYPCKVLNMGETDKISQLVNDSKRACTSSIFSAMLSTLVVWIVWEAQDPCIPLVIALFIVVAMSLGTVVQFLTKIQNRQGFHVVALLSLNWFMLGTLAFPALPYVANFFSPLMSRVGN